MFVLLRLRVYRVFAAIREPRRVTEITEHRAAADRQAIHLGKTLEHLLALLALDGRQEPVLFKRAGNAGHRHAGADQSPRQARAHADNGDRVLLLRIELARHAAEPALGPDLFGLAGVPDIHGPEVRTRRVLEADAVADGELALVPELLH